jgi:hypothetical protein
VTTVTRTERERPPTPWTAPNVAALDEVIAHIEVHPDAWKQDSWRCESGMCLAGWRVQLDGARWMADVVHALTPDGTPVRTVTGEDVGFMARELVWARGERIEIDWIPGDSYVMDAMEAKEWARRSLGLTRVQAAHLFDAGNTLADIRAMRDALIANPSDQLDGFNDATWDEL